MLEQTSAGTIQLLQVGEKVVTVTGENPYLVRGWDSNTGKLYYNDTYLWVLLPMQHCYCTLFKSHI